MRNVTVNFFAVLTMVVVLASCSKNQKVVKDLEGNWRVVEMIRNDTTIDQSVYANDVYTFEKCKVEKEDCSGKIATEFLGAQLVIPFTYSIREDGKTIKIIWSLNGTTQTSEGNITEQNDKRIVIEEPNDINGDNTKTTLEKK